MLASTTIPPDVRRALLQWFDQHGVPSRSVLARAWQRGGHGSLQGYIQWTAAKYGPLAAASLDRAVRESWTLEAESSGAQGLHASPQESPVAMRLLHERLPYYLLPHVPDAEFVVALGVALKLLQALRPTRPYLLRRRSQPGAIAAAVEYINGVFASRGVPYLVDAGGEITWQGDQPLHEMVVAPTLAALADPRIAGARDEFETALTHRREGTPKALEDAIEEAAKAVESVMKVMCDARAVKVPRIASAQHLFNALCEAGVVPAYAEYLILAAARIRNKAGGHGAGEMPRAIPPELAEACIRASATAITYLAAAMP